MNKCEKCEEQESFPCVLCDDRVHCIDCGHFDD